MSNGPAKTLEEVLRDNFSEKVAEDIRKLILTLHDEENMKPDRILAVVTLHFSHHLERDLTEDIITKGGNPKMGKSVRGKTKS